MHHLNKNLLQLEYSIRSLTYELYKTINLGNKFYKNLLPEILMMVRSSSISLNSYQIKDCKLQEI